MSCFRSDVQRQHCIVVILNGDKIVEVLPYDVRLILRMSQSSTSLGQGRGLQDKGSMLISKTSSLQPPCSLICDMYYSYRYGPSFGSGLGRNGAFKSRYFVVGCHPVRTTTERTDLMPQAEKRCKCDPELITAFCFCYAGEIKSLHHQVSSRSCCTSTPFIEHKSNQKRHA